MRVAGVFSQQIRIDPRLDPDPEEPLGIEYVLAAAQDRGHAARLFTPLDAPFHELADRIADFEPEVIAFSVFTKHVPRTLRLARELKALQSGVTTVAGGPHPTAVPELALEDCIDFCVIGEGEETFCDLLHALEIGRPVRDVHGLAFSNEGELHLTGSRARIEDLDSMPKPLREHRYYDLPAHSITYPVMSRSNWRPVLFSRGCNMPCTFCSSRELWGNAVQFRSPDDMLQEIRDLKDQHGVNSLFFEDLTFTLNRRRFLHLCDELARADLNMHWACETHVNTVDSGSLNAMAAAGCVKILWGVESVSDSTLDRVKKKQTHGDVARSLALATSRGILNWGCTIIGFPWETEEDILQSAELISELDIHQLRVSIATPFPGSEWHAGMPHSALNPDLSLYDTNHLVYDHPTIGPERMKELQNEVFRRFYTSAHYKDRAARMVRKFPHLRESFDEFISYIDDNLAKLDVGRTDLSEVHELQTLTV